MCVGCDITCVVHIRVSKWSLLLSHLLELLLVRLQNIVGHVAHVPSSVSYLPPLPWHVQQLQDEMVQLFVSQRGTDLFVSCTLTSTVSPFLMVSSLLFLAVKSWITRRYCGSSGLEEHYRTSDVLRDWISGLGSVLICIPWFFWGRRGSPIRWFLH